MKTAILRDKRFIVVGIGNIGRILISRLLETSVSASQILISESDNARKKAAASEFGVKSIVLTDEAVSDADFILLSTSPKAVPHVLHSIAPKLQPNQIVISFAALISLSRMEAIVPSGVDVVRVMPNAPSLVGAGMNPVVFGSSIKPEARELVTAVLATLGDTIEVQDHQINWYVGLSGAAMRSLLPVLEGMAQAGIEAGLSSIDARRIAAQVMHGTSALALETDCSFAEIKTLTPMQTVDETAVSQLFYNAARNTQEKMAGMQAKLESK